MEWSHLVGSSSLWARLCCSGQIHPLSYFPLHSTAVSEVINHRLSGRKVSSTLACFACPVPSWQSSNSSSAHVLVGILPCMSSNYEPLHFFFPSGKLVPLHRFARVLPVCFLHLARLRLPSNPIKFASIAKSARCSTCHGAHRDSYSPGQPLQEGTSSSAPTSYPKKEDLRLSFSV